MDLPFPSGSNPHPLGGTLYQRPMVQNMDTAETVVAGPIWAVGAGRSWKWDVYYGYTSHAGGPTVLLDRGHSSSQKGVEGGFARRRWGKGFSQINIHSPVPDHKVKLTSGSGGRDRHAAVMTRSFRALRLPFHKALT
ncbi:hypothetical protein SKAU_G00353410 [Synaphobranchus kaupii]|uniref:Uncharacterized protein n=1 Tax=Synaphobranchus kaupii TaxID=118154 RepID=A0A9Q1IG84_SYNKA|nr:hypothetical protein SKAU_G00353410 [Synaphobranchus kaupii]